MKWFQTVNPAHRALLRNAFRLLRKSLWMFAGSVLFGVLAVSIWFEAETSGQIRRSGEAVPKRNVALVLGTSERAAGGGPNLYFRFRVETAAALYLTGKVHALLLSGDNRTADYNEPDMMRKALRKRGVPDSVMVNDPAGLRTLDSVVRAHRVFGQDSLLIVSQRYHLMRALVIAQHEGMHAIGCEATTPDAHKWSWLKQFLREAFARIRVLADLYIWHEQPKYLGSPIPLNAWFT